MMTAAYTIPDAARTRNLCMAYYGSFNIYMFGNTAIFNGNRALWAKPQSPYTAKLIKIMDIFGKRGDKLRKNCYFYLWE